MLNLTLVQRIRLGLVAIVLAVGGVLVASSWPDGGIAYAAVLEDASGLVPRNDVRLNDIIVGQVSEITLEGLRERVDFEIDTDRSEETTSELQSIMRISYAVSCLK